jgi:hypothetical protein
MTTSRWSGLIPFTSSKRKKNYSSTARKYYKFNLTLLLAASLPMLLVGLFNYTIDPYDVLKSPTIEGVNYSKPDKLKNTRIFKAVDIINIKPVTIFLGSSRTDYGLDPQHPALNNSQPAYNSAIGAASPYEMLAYLKHAIANQKDLKLVVVGLDDFMFNELNGRNDRNLDKRLGISSFKIQDAIEFLFSFDVLSASIETLQSNLTNPNYLSYNPDGRLNLRPLDKNKEATKYRFGINLEVYFKSFPEYKFSTVFLNDFREVVELCRKKNIELKVFISPAHITQLEAIRMAGNWQMFEKMKRELVKITPVWDFSGYNSVTSEPLTNKIENYLDSSHYRKEIGDLILNRIFNYHQDRVPSDFGILLTPENLESHLEKIRDDREKWAKHGQKEIEFVKSIQLKIKSNQPK